MEELLSLSTDLNNLLGEKWDHSPTNEKFLLLKKWIKEVGEVACKEQEGGSLPATTESSSNHPAEEKKEEGEGSSLGGLASEAMELFLKKLAAFERLVQRSEYKKASIIADDVARTLESFNPLLYFPKLFISHFSLVAKHIEPIEMERGESESPLNRILEKLYQADLDAFIGWRGAG